VTAVDVPETDDEAFFTRRPSTAFTAATDDLNQYLNSRSTETSSITAWPPLKVLFLRLNTPLPAAERLFSCAGLTMNSRRTAMSDSLFEDLVLLKKNKSLWGSE